MTKDVVKNENMVVSDLPTAHASGADHILEWVKPKSRYSAGYIAWLLHRITALILVGYLFAHLFDVTLSWLNPKLYEYVVKNVFDSDIAKIGLIIPILWPALVFHGLNGIRILLFDLGIGVRHQKQLFYLTLIITLILWIAGAYWLLFLAPSLI